MSAPNAECRSTWILSQHLIFCFVKPRMELVQTSPSIHAFLLTSSEREDKKEDEEKEEEEEGAIYLASILAFYLAMIEYDRMKFYLAFWHSI